MNKEEHLAVFEVYLKNLKATRQECAYWGKFIDESEEIPERCILEEDLYNRKHPILTQKEADELFPYRDPVRKGRCNYPGNIFDIREEKELLANEVSQLKEQNPHLTEELKTAVLEIKDLKSR